MESRVACPVMNDAAFPAGFVWGTATAAHQVEGGNWNNDWWAWEHRPTQCADPSGDACDHYHRYREHLLAALGFGSYRSRNGAASSPPGGSPARRSTTIAAWSRLPRARLDAVDPITSPSPWWRPRRVCRDQHHERFLRFVSRLDCIGDLVNRWYVHEPIVTFGYLTCKLRWRHR